MDYSQGKSQRDAGLQQPDTEGDLCQQPGVSRAFCSSAKSRCFSRMERCAGFCSEEFVLCLQRTAKNWSKANCSLAGEKERPPGCQAPGRDEGQGAGRAAHTHCAHTTWAAPAVPDGLLGLQPLGGQHLPRCSAWVPWPGFQASRLKGTKW